MVYCRRGKREHCQRQARRRGGGSHNTASADYATIAGGGPLDPTSNPATTNNRVTDDYGAIGGGAYNQVGNADGDTLNARFATVGGGERNVASGEGATVAGGSNNVAQGAHSFAAGFHARALHNSSFVWNGSGFDINLDPTAPKQFVVSAPGGVRLGANLWPSVPAGRFINTSTGGYLSTGGAWTDASDRNAKENFKAIDKKEVLARLTEISINEWNYKAEDDGVRHIGPAAQDFYAAFGLGQDDRHIAPLDTNGVALAAIQGLHNLLKEKESDVSQPREKIGNLESRLKALELLVTGEKNSE